MGFLPCLNPSRGREAEGQRAGEQPSRTAVPGLTGLAQPCVPVSLLDPVSLLIAVSLLIPMPCPGSGGGPSTAPLPRGPPSPKDHPCRGCRRCRGAPQSPAVINIQQTEQVLEMPGCSGGARTSGGSSVCFSFHLSALIFRALQFGQTNISRVHGESMQCSAEDIIHLSPLSATSLQTGINKTFIVLHHRNAPKLGKKNRNR